MPNTPLDQLTLSVFSKLVKTKFKVYIAENRNIELELAAANSRSTATSPTDTFSLIFLGRVDQPLTQMTYLFEHAEIGQFHLFIVPVGRTAAAMEYEAIFSRPRPKS